MSARRPAVALAAFEPFAGRRRNAAWEAAREAARLGGVEPVRLPVDFQGLPRAVGAVLAPRPRSLVMVGEASRARALRVERVAVNLIDARIADNRGRRPRDRPVVCGGPAAYFATLDPGWTRRVLVRRARCELSVSAGAFVCNAAFYLALHRSAGTAVAFVHVPASARVLSSRRAGRAIAELVRRLAQRRRVPVPAGAAVSYNGGVARSKKDAAPRPPDSARTTPAAAKVAETVKKAMKWSSDLVNRSKNVIQYGGDSEFSTVGVRPKPVELVRDAHTPRAIPRSRAAKGVPPKDIKG